MLLRSLLSSFCVIGLILPLVVSADDASERLQNVQSEIHTLSKELDLSKSSKKQLYQQLKKHTQAAASLNRQLLELDKAIVRRADELKKLKRAVEQENHNHTAQLNDFEQQIRAAFTNAKPSYLKVLLNQHDPAKLSRSSVYFQYFHEARQQQLEQITESLAALSDKERALFAAQRSQQQDYQDRKNQQHQLNEQKKQRHATLAALNAKIGQQSEQIASLRQEEQALQNVFKKLAKKADEKPVRPYKSNAKFSSLKGRLAWPLSGKLSARYGTKRNLGKLTWQGIMIDAPSGKEVRSVASGQVVFADWLRGFGLLIIIDHGDKYMTLYGNNQTLLKEVGDNVSAGELIAQSGDKGIRQHAGLYFEIRHKGSPTNPQNWLGKQS